MEIVKEEAPTQLVLALDHFVCSQVLPIPSVDGRAILLLISSERQRAKQARGVILTALTTPLGRNIPCSNFPEQSQQLPCFFVLTKALTLCFGISGGTGGIRKGEGKEAFHHNCPWKCHQLSDRELS